MKKIIFLKKNVFFKKNSAFTLIEISIAVLIIGILVASISQVYEMIFEASLKSARNLSRSSRVTRIDDLILWLDATSEKAFDKEKEDNSTISIWKDTNPKSTTPISSTSSSASLYPSYVLSAINSLPAIKFKKTSSSVGNCITIPNKSFINNSENFTLYLTYSPTTLDDGIIIEKNNATATTFPFSLELSSGFYKFSVKDSASTISVIGPKQAKINTPNLIRLSRTKGSQIEISINGVSSTQSDTLTSSTFNNAELSIGCRNGDATPANFINGNIGETTFFNRDLSVKEKTEIEEYLYKKWKMKKYEGALATQDFIPCSVPNTLNTTADGSTVTYTSSPVPLTCKSGFSGNVTYTCNGSGVISTTGGCFGPCTVPLPPTTIDGYARNNSDVIIIPNNTIYGPKIPAGGLYTNSAYSAQMGYPTTPVALLELKCENGVLFAVAIRSCYDNSNGQWITHNQCSLGRRSCRFGSITTNCDYYGWTWSW